MITQLNLIPVVIFQCALRHRAYKVRQHFSKQYAILNMKVVLSCKSNTFSSIAQTESGWSDGW